MTDFRLKDISKAIREAVTGLEIKPPDEGAEGSWIEKFHEKLHFPESMARTVVIINDLRWSIVSIWLDMLKDMTECLSIINREEIDKPEHLPATSHPKAPRGLLSLSDYSAIHTALELVVFWGIIPSVEPGVGPFDPDSRIPAKVVKVHRRLLRWGIEHARKRKMVVEEAAYQLMSILDILQRILNLPQFSPILLPRYLPDVLSGLLQVSNGYLTDYRSRASIDLNSLLSSINPRLTIGALRQLLGRGKCAPHWLRIAAGKKTTELVQLPGGVDATLEAFLGGGSAFDSKAQSIVATLLGRIPRDTSIIDYVKAVAPQIILLLQRRGEDTAFVSRRIGVMILGKLASTSHNTVSEFILIPMFRPILQIFDYEKCQQSGCENDIDQCVSDLQTLLIETTPLPPLVDAIIENNIFEAIFSIYAFARQTHSRLLQECKDILIVLITHTKDAAGKLQSCLLQSRLHRLIEFNIGGTGGVVIEKILSGEHRKCEDGKTARINLKSLKLETEEDDESQIVAKHIQDIEWKSEVVVELLQQLGQEDKIAGQLFAYLLKEYLDFHSRNLIGEDRERCIMVSLSTLADKLGPSLLTSGLQMLQCFRAVLESETKIFVEEGAYQCGSIRSDDLSRLVLGLLTAMVELGETNRSADEENELIGMLPILELICKSTLTEADLAEMASMLCVQILSRGQNDAHRVSEHEQLKALSNLSIDDDAHFESVMLKVLADAKEDLESTMVPLRARGVVTLTRLLRTLFPQIKTNRMYLSDVIGRFMDTYMYMIQDTESYVYLAAIQGLSVLADVSPAYIIPKLVAVFCNSQDSYTLVQRIKVGEAILFSAKRCGEACPKYAHHFVNAFVIGGRDRGMNNQSEHVIFRTSCLSNLSEVCALLGWSFRPYARDVVDLAIGTIRIETGSRDEDIRIRRAATYLLFRILDGLGADVIHIIPDLLKSMYATLKLVAHSDIDDVSRFHAGKGLEQIDKIMVLQWEGT